MAKRKNGAQRGQGSICKRGGSNNYYFRYYVTDDTGKRKQIWRSLDTANFQKAEAEAQQYRVLLAAENHEDQLRNIQLHLGDAEERVKAAQEALRVKLAVADAWEAFAAAPNRKQCSKVTLKDYDQRWAYFARWWLDRAPTRPAMESVAIADARAFAAWLDQQTLSPNRRNKIVQTARYVFNTLAEDCNGMVNPFGTTSGSGIPNKPQRPRGRRALSEAELLDVCQSAERELRTLLAIGLYCGLRLKDAALLTWDAINLPMERLVVTPSKTRNTSGKTLVIPLHNALIAILEETPREARRGPVLPDTAELYERDRTTLSRHIQNHFKACGILTAETDEEQTSVRKRVKVGFHSLRHTFVTIAAKSGIPLAVVQELCGHGSPEIQRAYLHMGEQETRQAVLAMPDITAPAKALPAPTATLEPASAPQDNADLLARIRARLDAEQADSPLRSDLLAILNG